MTERVATSTPEQRVARLRLSSEFLDKILLPKIKSQENGLKAEEIPDLYASFRREHQGLGDDFELGHVWQEAWKRDLINEEIASRDASKLPGDAPDIVVAMGLLEQFAFGKNIQV